MPSKSHQHGRLPQLRVHVPPATPLKAPAPISPEMLLGKKRRLKRRFTRELWLCQRHRQTASSLKEANAVACVVCSIYPGGLLTFLSSHLLAYSSTQVFVHLFIYLSKLLNVSLSIRLSINASVRFPTCLFDPICSDLIQSNPI